MMIGTAELKAAWENKPLVSVLSFLLGGLVTKITAFYQNRVKVLEYSVVSERVGFSDAHPVLGRVSITWQGSLGGDPNTLDNLHMTRVVISNSTSKDFTDVKFTVYTSEDTFILTEQTQIEGTAFILPATLEYADSIRVTPGQEATDHQRHKYWHEREYKAVVLNRGQRLTIVYLTTVPSSANLPTVLVETLIEGAKLVRKEPTVDVHGVPLGTAVRVGLFICLCVVLGAGLLLRSIWAGATLCIFVGLYAQFLGAHVYRALQ